MYRLVGYERATMNFGRDFFFSECFVEIFSTFETFFRPKRSEGRKNVENVEKFERKHERASSREPLGPSEQGGLVSLQPFSEKREHCN